MDENRKHGNQAYCDVFTREYGKLLAWCRRRIEPGLGDPEDFVHAAFLRCWGRWTPEAAPPRREIAYVYRALQWLVLDARRARSRQRKHLSKLPRPSQGARWLGLREACTQEALDLLTKRQSQVCLALLDGKADSQIRRELRLTSGALAAHRCRARANLCELLGLGHAARHRQRRPTPRPARPRSVSSLAKTGTDN